MTYATTTYVQALAHAILGKVRAIHYYLLWMHCSCGFAGKDLEVTTNSIHITHIHVYIPRIHTYTI